MNAVQIIALLLCVALAAGCLPLLLRAQIRTRITRDRWRKAAVTNRLKFHSPRLPLSRWTLSGAIGPLQVKGACTRLNVRMEVGPVDRSLHLRPETSTLKGDGASGDPQFDRKVRAEGEPLALAASLDAGARAEIARAVGAGIVVRAGSVVCYPGPLQAENPDFDGWFRLMLSTASSARGRSLKQLTERVCEIACTDPLPGVRRACLMALMDKAWDSPELQKAASQALTSRDPELLALGRAAAGLPGGVQPALAVSPRVAAAVTRALARE